ncbi:hypothetical protein BVX98_01495, partial [bacterium F11]
MKFDGIKKWASAGFALLFSMGLSIPASSGLMTDILKEILEEELKVSAKNFTDPSKINQYLNDAANDNPEKIVSDAFGNLSPGSMGVAFLTKIMPTMATPIGLLTTASDLAHTGTEYWLNWAREQKLEEFQKAVLTKTSSTKLKNAYHTFINNWITGGGDYAGRKTLENKMHEAYLHRFAEVRKMERYEKNKKRVRAHALHTLNKAVASASRKMDWAVGHLKVAGKEPTPDLVRRMLKDDDFSKQTIREGRNRVKKSIEAREKKRKGLAVTGPIPSLPPKEDLTPDLKAQVIVSESVARLPEKTKSLPPPDFRPLYQSYKEAAEKLFANIISVPEYQSTVGNIRTSANQLKISYLDRLTDPYSKKTKKSKDAINKAYE